MELHELRHYVELALEQTTHLPAIRAAEVCASWNEQCVVQVFHDTERPRDEHHTSHTHPVGGLSVLVVLAEGEGQMVGFASTDEALEPDSIQAVIETARQSARREPRPLVLPRPLEDTAPPLMLYDPQVLGLLDDDLSQRAVDGLEGALTTCQDAGYRRGLRVRGEVRSQAEHLVVGNTHGLLVSETTTSLLATLHVWLTQAQSHGMGQRATTHWRYFHVDEAGTTAAQQALRGQGSVGLPAGEYAVIFGPRAVAALWQDLLVPALSLDTVAGGTSPFAVRRGHPIASPLLTLIDNPRLPGQLGSRLITGDGLPTSPTTLIEDGRLVSFLADAYHAQHLQEHVGVIVPRHGLRHAPFGRSFVMRPGIFPTNLLCTSPDAVPLDELVAPLEHGVYIGDLWHLATPTGLHTGHCTGLVLGPSFVIRQGQLAEPLRPGTLCLDDNWLDLLQHLTGVSTTQQPVPLATRQSLALAPEWRCSRVRLVTPQG